MNIFRSLVLLFFPLALSLSAQANVLGNMQTLAPTPDSLYFQNVHSSMTLAEGRFNVGFFAAYVKDQISAYDDLVTPQIVDYKDYGIASDFILAYGLTNNFELIYSVPGFIDQNPDKNQVQQHHISSGVNTHRPGIKYNFSQDRRGGFGASASVDFPVSQEDPYVGNDPKPIYNLELIYDYRRSRDAFGFNVGYRKRSPGTTPASAWFYPLRDQLIYSAAYVYGVGSPQRYHFELYGAAAADSTPHPDAKYVRSLEGLIGFKQRVTNRMWWHIGGTAEILPQGLAPAYRLYSGLNIYFGGKEKAIAPIKRPESSPLRVIPSAVELPPGGTQTFEVSGGKTPYKYRLEPPFGDFDEFDQTYRAPSESGTTVLVVEDARGANQRVPITVGDGQRRPLVVSPGAVQMLEGGRQLFRVSGGTPPYNYRLLQPVGRFNPETLSYHAPTQPGETELLVEDSVGNSITVTIVITALPKPQRDFVIHNLVFVFDTAQLTPESRVLLDRNIDALRSMQITRMVVAGHTDSMGSDDYNQELSRERAQTVADILITRLGLEPTQVEAIGYGESRPIATNETDEGRQRNRRVELKIYHKNSGQ